MAALRRKSAKLNKGEFDAYLTDLSGSAAYGRLQERTEMWNRDRREQRVSCKSARGIEDWGRRKLEPVRDDADLEDAAEGKWRRPWSGKRAR